MDNDLVIISNDMSFLLDAVSMNLKAAGIHVTEAEATVDDVVRHQNDASVFLFFLGGNMEPLIDTFIFLKSAIEVKKKVLLLAGTEKDFEFVQQYIPNKLVAEKFLRPYNIFEMVQQIQAFMNAKAARSRRKNLLLVDDDSTYLRMLHGTLSKKYNVAMVTSGMRAIAYMADHRPDLVLLDYEMPITNGPTILAMLRADDETKGIPVVFLTGKNDEESVRSVLELNPNGYLLKSTNLNGVSKYIEEFFAKQPEPVDDLVDGMTL